jgi:two-component system, cell cycle response regulator
MRVLIADDDPGRRRMIADALGELGDEVDAVGDGVQAWQALEGDDRPALAILHRHLPGLDGIEVCRRLRQSGAGAYVYVLLLTADHQAEAAAGFQAGADDYLMLPFGPEELRGRRGAAERVIQVHADLRGLQRDLQVQAGRDSPGGLWNRGAILDLLGRELARGQRLGNPVGVMVADLDEVERIEEAHGRAAVDAVVRQMGERLQSSVRSYDSVGRYGPSGALFVLPACDLPLAARSGERVRRSLERAPFAIGKASLRVTATVGVASSMQAEGAGSGPLVAAAEGALRRGQAAGGNRVEQAAEVEGP